MRDKARAALRAGTSVLATALVVTAAGLPVAAPAAADSTTPLGQQLAWTDDGRSYTQAGADTEVRISSGRIAFVDDCPTGFNDFVYPDSDVYVVPVGSVTPGGPLVDASGGLPNTVRGTAGGGSIISEVVAATQPTGTLGSGSYAVVYDECQNGTYDAGTDAVFEPALDVVVPADIPSLPSSAILAMKSTADAEATFWATSTQWMTVYLNTLELLGLVTGLKDGGTIGIDDPIMYLAGTAFGTQLPDVKLAALQLMLNTAKHWRAISDDPPDPAFRQVTTLAPQPQLESPVDTPLASALYALAESAGSEAAVAEAVLHSLERYQGADEAEDMGWARIHARAVRDHATLLQSQLPRTDVRIDALLATLRADTRDYDAEIADLEAVRAHIVSEGFTDEQRRELASAGFTAADVDAFRADQATTSYAGFSKATLVHELEQLRAGREASGAAMARLATDMQPIVDALAPAAGDVPVADAGGPYTGNEGEPVAFDGSGSTSRTDLSYAWDLDGDGAFDDGSAATAAHTYGSSWAGVVGLRVRDSAGLTHVDFAPVTVADTNGPPRVGRSTPAGDTALVTVGDTTAFTVEAGDPEGGTPSVRWELGGTAAGTGPRFAYTPGDADVGVHALVAVVDDGTPTGGQVRRTWLVLVLPRDADSDGWRANEDCDDDDPSVHPGAPEVVGNGKDDDCDPSTSELGAPPRALYAATGESGNVGLAERGATVSSSSGTPHSGHTPSEMIDFSSTDLPWAAGRAETAPFAVVDLPGTSPYAVDAVQVRPRVDYPDQRVKAFAVDVSTTTDEPGAFRTVLTATAAATSELQTFELPERTFATHVRYRPLSGNGGASCGGCISTSQFRVLSPQWQDASVAFENLSTPGQADIVGHLWDFDDGTTSTAADPTHVFAEPGTYDVRLTTRSADGQTSSHVTTQVVEAAPKVAWDRVSPTGAPYEGEAVALADRSVPVASATVVQREYSWGDGGVSATGSHTYDDDGTYPVTLEVLDSTGAIGRATADLTVLNRAPSVDAGGDAGWVGGTELVDRALRDRSPVRISDAGRADTWTCSWDYGDDSPRGTGCEFVHTYQHSAPWGTVAAPKTFTPTLTVTDSDGATSTDRFTVTVRPRRTPAPENLVRDGDFEAASAGLWYAYLHSTNTSLAPWKIEGDSVDLLSTYFQDAASGAQSLNVNGSGPGGVSQRVPTVPGTTYRLRFAVAANVEGGDPVVSTDVAWGSTSLGRVSVDARGDDRRTVGWRYEERLVTATETSTRLAFTSTDPTPYGPVVDDVSLVAVAAANRPPVARDVPGVTTPEDTAVVIGFDAADPDGDPLQHAVVDPPSSGTLSAVRGAEVTYTPANGYSGPDSFTYRVSDGTAESGVARVSIVVTAVDERPVAADDTAVTDEDRALDLTAADLLANDTDADGDPLTVAVASQPSSGTVVQRPDGTLTYTPARDFAGSDSFTYRALDGTLASSPATVTVTVRPVNDAPVVVLAPVAGGAVEGAALALSATATDVDGDPVTWAWAATASEGVDAGASCRFDAGTTATPTVRCDDDGTFTLRVTVDDGHGRSASAERELVVRNASPVVGDLRLTGHTGTGCLGASPVTLAVGWSDPGTNDTHEGTVDWGDGSPAEPFTGTELRGEHRYPAGTYTVTVTVTDDDGGTGERTATDVVSRPYEISGGFAQPLNSDGSSVFKLGSTIPVKLLLRDCTGAVPVDLSPDVDLVRLDTQASGAVNEVVSSSAADVGDDLRLVGGHYLYNLSTKNSQFCDPSGPLCSGSDLTPGTYRLTVSDQDSPHPALRPVSVVFRLRR